MKRSFTMAAKANRSKGNGRNTVSRAEARKVLDASSMNLGEVRDLLEAMEQGDCGDATTESRAMFARCALVDAATELEQALFDLGLLTKGEHDYRPGGWFVQEYPKAEARHG
jgi:hypothetical protein